MKKNILRRIRIIDVVTVFVIFIILFIVAGSFYTAGRNDGKNKAIESVSNVEVFPDGEVYITFGENDTDKEIHQYLMEV